MRTILNLNRDWTFIKGLENVPVEIPETAEVVTLPHTWNAKDGQDGGNDYWRGIGTYTMELPNPIESISSLDNLSPAFIALLQAFCIIFSKITEGVFLL